MRIRHQLLVVMAVVTLLPVLVAGVIAYRLSLSRLNAQADENLTTVARRIASEVDSFAYRVLDSTRSDALIPRIVEFAAARHENSASATAAMSQLLHSAVIPDPVNVSSCAVFDLEGRKLLDTSPTGAHVHDESNEPWIRRPLDEGIPVLISQVGGADAPAIWVGAPLRDNTGRKHGVLRLRYELAAIHQIVARLSDDTGRRTTAVILDDSGRVLVQGNGLPDLGDDAPIEPMRVGRESASILEVNLGWGNFSPEATNDPDSQDRLARVSLHNAPWTVAIVQTPSSYNTSTRELGRTLLLLGLLVIGLVAISGLIAAHRISRPIASLAQAANEIDAGRLDYVVPEQGTAEMRALANALNHMTGRLSGTLQALEERAGEFQAIVEGSPVAMSILSNERRFTYLNASFVDLFGYTREDLPDLDTWWVRAYPNPAYRKEVIELFENRVLPSRNKGSRVSPAIEAIVSCKDGTKRHIEFRSLWMGESRLTTFTDLTTHKQAQRVREILLESLGGLSGRAFFERLAREAAALFGAERVYIGRFEDPCSDVQTPLVIWQRGEFVERGRPPRSVADGPAEMLRNEGHFMFWPDVTAAFPLRAEGYRNFGVVSYAGLPLRNARGEVAGTISVMFDRAFAAPEPLRASLELLASRAAMELDRLDAAEVLRKSEERYRTLVTHAPDAIVVFDCETGLFVDCNENAEQLFKLPREVLLQRGPLDLSPPEQPSGLLSSTAALDNIAAALDGRLQTFEWIHRNSEGVDFPCEVRLVRMPDPSRMHIRGSILDISDRKRALERLKRSEQRFAALFNMSPVSKVISTPNDGIIIDVNPAACELIGLPREQLLGRSAPEFANWSPGERARIVEQVMVGRKPLADERVLRTGDGRQVTVLIHLNYIELDGEDRLLTSIIDITDRKRAEDILRENEERFRMLIENSNELVILVSRDGTILYASPNHEAITGYRTEEVVGTNALEHVHPEDLTSVAAKLGEPSAAALFRYRFKDGTWHWIESSGKSFALPSGEERSVVVSRDISARVAADETRKVLEAQLRQSQKLEAIGTLAGGIAHDFNNILTGVMGHLELVLLDLPKAHSLRSQLDDAFSACKRARDLIGQILTFSRQREPTRQPARIGPIIKEAMRLLRASLPTTIEIEVHIDDATPAIECDVTQIHQLVMNLGTNAAHALRTGGTLSVSLRRVVPDPEEMRRHVNLRPHHTVCLSVHDTGCGMDPATLERIFDPFFTTKEPGEGTGLGLPVVHGIMQEHNGVIVVSSTPGMGTHFDLYFPPAAIDTQPKPAAPIASGTLPNGNGRRLLLVDDESTVRSVGTRILVRLGYEVLACPGAVEALAVFRRDPERFDAVLSDLTMPELTGVDLARECFTLRPGVPFVLMTGYLKNAQIDNARAIGITRFLRKPFDFSSLVEALDNVWTPKS